MAFANKWARFLSYIGRRLFFLLIFLQVPLFRIPYRGEICTTPLELTCHHLISIDIGSPIVIKSLLYPGVLANALIKDKTVLNFNNMLQIYRNISSSVVSNENIDLNRVEVLVGSYLSVGGAVLGGLLWPTGRMSLLGTLLTLWGLKKDLFLESQTGTPREDVSMYPAMLIAIILAFFSIKGDVRNLIRCFRRRRKAKYY